MAKVTNLSVAHEIGLEHGVDIRWVFKNAKNTDHFNVDCEYAVKQNAKKTDWVWISAQVQEFTVANASVNPKNTNFRVSWTAPSNALVARVRVAPVAITDTKKNKPVSRYKSEYTKKSKIIDFRTVALPAPSLSVSFDAETSKATVTVTSNDVDARTCRIWAVYSGKNSVNQAGIQLSAGSATKVYTVSAGQTWVFHATCSTDSNKKTSPEATVQTVTAKPGQPSLVNGSWKSYGEDGIKFSWSAVTGAVSYTVEYVADNAAYFTVNRDAVRTVTGITGNTFVQTGLEAGHTWYMRVQAVNASGNGSWTNGSTAYAKLALVPDAPTTYDTDPSYKRNETVRMRWTHNCEDNADQTAAQVRMKKSTQTDGQASTTTVSPGTDSYLVKSLSSYSDGDVVMWSVRTKGNRSEWSPWSIWRQFTVYDVPTVTCVLSQPGTGSEASVDDDEHPLSSLPLTVTTNASGGGSSVCGYHVAVKAAEDTSYDEMDGSETIIAAGNIVYERDYDTNETPFDMVIGVEAGLPDACVLSITVDAVMASGLRCESTAVTFGVNFDNNVPTPTSTVYFDDSELTASIECACYAVDEDGAETENLVTGVVLSVYRINNDKSLSLIESGLENSGNAVVIDPHANFGICEYRVVATDTSTGMSSYEDGADASVHQTCCVQWDERWDKFTESEDEDGLPVYTYSGSRIDGLYNLNLDESGNMQAEDAEYIGRKHPVSYYGTQRGHTASYRVDFPKSDTATLAKCRRLMDYAGDAYVREPSGLGFWAHVSNPRISRSYDSQAISFTFDAIHVDHPEEAVR